MLNPEAKMEVWLYTPTLPTRNATVFKRQTLSYVGYMPPPLFTERHEFLTGTVPHLKTVYTAT